MPVCLYKLDQPAGCRGQWIEFPRQYLNATRNNIKVHWQLKIAFIIVKFIKESFKYIHLLTISLSVKCTYLQYLNLSLASRIQSNVVKQWYWIFRFAFQFILLTCFLKAMSVLPFFTVFNIYKLYKYSYRCLVSRARAISDVAVQKPINRHIFVEDLNVCHELDHTFSSKHFPNTSDVTEFQNIPVRIRVGGGLYKIHYMLQSKMFTNKS